MKKLLLILILTPAFPFQVFGQNQCPMPMIEGISLGMSVTQVEEQLKVKLLLKQDKTFKYLPEAKTASIKKKKGLRVLLISFYKSTAFSIDAEYDDSVKRGNFLEFAETAVKNLGLSPSNLEYEGRSGNPVSKQYADKAFLYCDNFVLSTSFIAGLYGLGFADNAAIIKAKTENDANLKKIQQARKFKSQLFQ